MSTRETGSGTVLLAFLTGAVTGAAVALLFAPAPGDETRQYLSDRAREGRERAATAAREGRERASAAARQGREVISRQKDQIVSAIEQGRDAYQKARHTSEEPA